METFCSYTRVSFLTLDRVCASIHLHHLTVPKVLGEQSRVHCGRHQNDPQLWVCMYHVPQQHQQKVSLRTNTAGAPIFQNLLYINNFLIVNVILL